MLTRPQLDALAAITRGEGVRRDVLARLLAAELVDVEVRYAAADAGLRPEGLDATLTAAGRRALDDAAEPAAWRAGRLF